MLHQKTVSPKTLDLIRLLMADHFLSNFNLVGGTSLSLQIGHRMSIDIDLFTSRPFNPAEIASALTQKYDLVEDLLAVKNSIFCHINGIKVDFITHQYPLIHPPQYIDGIRLLSLEDIGAMKLHAIVNSGDRLKDFIDIYALLEHISLKEMYEAYEKKYYPNVNYQMAQAGLLYHDEIDFSYPLSLLGRKLDWQMVKTRLKDAVLYTTRIFSEPKISTTSKIQKREKRKKG